MEAVVRLGPFGHGDGPVSELIGATLPGGIEDEPAEFLDQEAAQRAQCVLRPIDIRALEGVPRRLAEDGAGVEGEPRFGVGREEPLRDPAQDALDPRDYGPPGDGVVGERTREHLGGEVTRARIGRHGRSPEKSKKARGEDAERRCTGNGSKPAIVQQCGRFLESQHYTIIGCAHLFAPSSRMNYQGSNTTGGDCDLTYTIGYETLQSWFSISNLAGPVTLDPRTGRKVNKATSANYLTIKFMFDQHGAFQSFEVLKDTNGLFPPFVATELVAEFLNEKAIQFVFKEEEDRDAARRFTPEMDAQAMLTAYLRAVCRSELQKAQR